MDKIICPQCGKEISKEFGATRDSCANCGANLRLPTEEKAVLSNNAHAPKSNSPLPTILLTSFFTALFLLVLFAGGVYWFINQKTINVIPDEPAKVNQTKPTPRAKKQSSIGASEITRIQYSYSTMSTRASVKYFFGNVNPNNFVTRSGSVSFSRDGEAVKINNQSSNIEGVQVPTTPQRLTGKVTPEQFSTLAEVFVENDFLNEPDSKTSTSLPLNYTLTVFYSTGKKEFKTSNSGSDTPEAEAMLKAFQRLENSVVWKTE